MRMMMNDGGSAPRPGVVSRVTVDPGDIRDFARFLDEMSREVQRIEDELLSRQRDAQPLEFGAYYASSQAQKRHDDALRAALDNARALRRRIETLATGTVTLSRRYADLEDLNRAISSDITDALRTKGA